MGISVHTVYPPKHSYGPVWTVWASLSAPVILVHVLKGMGEVEFRPVSMMINKYTLSQPHHWSHSSETAEPITVKHDNIILHKLKDASSGNHIVVWKVQC